MFLHEKIRRKSLSVLNPEILLLLLLLIYNFYYHTILQGAIPFHPILLRSLFHGILTKLNPLITNMQKQKRFAALNFSF